MAELKVFLEVVWTNLFFNDREAEAYRGYVIGLGCSGDGHICAGQYTFFFFKCDLCDLGKPMRPCAQEFGILL